MPWNNNELTIKSIFFSFCNTLISSELNDNAIIK